MCRFGGYARARLACKRDHSQFLLAITSAPGQIHRGLFVSRLIAQKNCEYFYSVCDVDFGGSGLDG